MSPVICPNCNVAVPAREVKDGWCENCGKRLPTFARSLPAGGPQRPRADESEPAPAGPAGEELTGGQKFLFVLFFVACLFVVVSALAGDAKSIRALVRVAGTAVGFTVVAGVAALFRRRP
jgi:hypothetical protein